MKGRKCGRSYCSASVGQACKDEGKTETDPLKISKTGSTTAGMLDQQAAGNAKGSRKLLRVGPFVERDSVGNGHTAS